MRLQLKNTALRLAEVADAAFILQLRTDKILSRFLNKTDNNLLRQQQWLQAYKQREAEKKEYYFIIENATTAEPIGTVRLYNIQGEQYTSGSWILKKGTPSNAATLSDYMITYFGFETLGFNRCFFDVRKENKKVLAFHKRFAAYVSEDEENIYMAMDRSGFAKKKEFFERVLGITNEELAVMVTDPA